MKKILSILLAVLLLVTFTACGKTISTGGDKPEGGFVEVTTEDSKETTSAKEEATTTTAAPTEEITTPAAGDAGTGDDNYDYSDGDTGYVEPEQPEDVPTEPVTEAPTEPVTEAPTDPPAQTWTITVTVDGKDHGGVFGGGTYAFYYQPTAFDALVATGLSYTGDGNYVSSINGLAEFDGGPLSGWLYAVNGTDPSIGCGSYYLEDGDTVYWHYTDDYTLE